MAGRPESKHAQRDQLLSERADRFESFGVAKMQLFDYLEVFYKQRRRHSTLGQVSPAVFEKARATQGA